MTAIFAAGCSALPEPPPRPVLYDFGPGAVPASAAQPAPALPAIALADVAGAGSADTSTAVLYRLAYADARQRLPYQMARWSLPPAQLVEQDLRAQLGQRRAVLRTEDGLAAARSANSDGSASSDGVAALNGLGGSQPDVLRVRLEEFSQVFSSAQDSVGLIRLRATLTEPTAAGEKLHGQRLFVVQQPARSADAAGGTRALAEASTQVAQELAQWLEQMGR